MRPQRRRALFIGLPSRGVAIFPRLNRPIRANGSGWRRCWREITAETSIGMEHPSFPLLNDCFDESSARGRIEKVGRHTENRRSLRVMGISRREEARRKRFGQAGHQRVPDAFRLGSSQEAATARARWRSRASRFSHHRFSLIEGRNSGGFGGGKFFGISWQAEFSSTTSSGC